MLINMEYYECFGRTPKENFKTLTKLNPVFHTQLLGKQHLLMYCEERKWLLVPRVLQLPSKTLLAFRGR
jgi:hypothetical protein